MNLQILSPLRAAVIALSFLPQAPWVQAQDAPALTKALRAQEALYNGQTVKWVVQQETRFSKEERDQMAEAVGTPREELLPREGEDDTRLRKANAIANFLANLPELSEDRIEVTGKFVSPTRWRIVRWQTDLPPQNSDVYLADGSGTVFVYEHGLRRIRVEPDAAAALAEALQGEVPFALAPHLAAVDPAKVKLTKDKAGADALLFASTIATLAFCDGRSSQIASSRDSGLGRRLRLSTQNYCGQPCPNYRGDWGSFGWQGATEASVDAG